MKKNKTIICFDSWTKGYYNFNILSKPLKKFGYKLLLIHTGSWGHDKGRPKEEYIEKLLVRDISYYNSKSFLDILKLENPKAVLFLSTRAFLHQAFNRYARFLSIPTIHRFHGLISVQPINNKGSTFKFNFLSRLKFAFSVLKKNLKIILPIYIKSLIITKAELKHWFAFFKEIINKFTYSSSNAPYDSQTDLLFIYTEADLKYAIDTYHMNKNNIHIVGNPDYSSFVLKKSDIKSRINQILNTNKVIYINTGTLEEGVVFTSLNDMIKYYKNICNYLKSLNKKLLIKLHPSLEKQSILKKFKELDIKIISKKNLINEIKDSEFAIVEPSTVSILPAIIGIPVFLTKLGKFKSQDYGKVLTSYPKSIYLKNLNQLQKGFKTDSFKIDKIDNWLDFNIGPSEFSKMPERTAKIIDDFL